MGIFLKIREKVLYDEGPELDCTMRCDWWLEIKKPWEQDTSYPFFESFSSFIQHDSSDFSDATRRIITLIISVSSFVIITGYFCNLMATDMVVVDKPDVMNTYDDILARPAVTILFVKQFTDYEHFRDADKDSKEYKLWKVMTTERSTEDKVFLDPQGVERLTLYYLDSIHGLVVFIASRFIESIIRIVGCRLRQILGSFSDLISYAAVDPNSPVYGKGLIFRQANIPFLFTAAKRARRSVEVGYGIITKNNIHTVGYNLDFGDTKIDWDNFRDCMSPTLVMDKPEFQAASLANYRSLAIFVACSFSISLAILIMENIYFVWKYGGRRLPQRREKRRRVRITTA